MGRDTNKLKNKGGKWKYVSPHLFVTLLYCLPFLRLTLLISCRSTRYDNNGDLPTVTVPVPVHACTHPLQA